MKILFLADEESKMYWEYFKKEDFKGIDVIVSCGDLNPSYLRSEEHTSELQSL